MATTDLDTGRSNQKTRTRLALVEAASQLIEDGHDPTLEEVAERALVSRATAYRYFSSAEEVLAEAALASRDLGTPEQVLASLDADASVADRVDHVVRHISRLFVANPRATHLMLRSVYDLWLTEPNSRVGRRIAFLEAALAGHTEPLDDEQRARLLNGLALVCGAEAVLSALDVCGLDPDEAIETIAWAARALVDRSLAS